MAKQTDITSDLLFEVYSKLQDLLKHHLEIDQTLKDMALKVSSQPHDFEPIENAADAIIDTCEKLESYFSPKRCLGGCCRQA